VTTDEVVQAAAVAGAPIRPGTVRVWSHRGLIVKLGRDRYDRASVLRWLLTERRDTRAGRRSGGS
jgi:hypothetical protein